MERYIGAEDVKRLHAGHLTLFSLYSDIPHVGSPIVKETVFPAGVDSTDGWGKREFLGMTVRVKVWKVSVEGCIIHKYVPA